MKEVKITIPDNCELVKDGDSYVVIETKQNPPRSWEEFCEKYPKKMGETFISSTSEIFAYNTPSIRDEKRDKNVCPSKEETEAFLALMQLRQLRKAWVGDWDFVASPLLSCHAIVYTKNSGLRVRETSSNHPMSFPTTNMAEDFFNCFKELLEKAKIFL